MQFIYKVLFASLILLAPLKGFAAFDKALWNKYFDGEPDLVGADWRPAAGKWDLSGRAFEYKTWIRGYSRCAGEVEGLLQNLAQYEQSYVIKNFADADSRFAQIQTALDLATPCRDVLVRAYAAGLSAMGPAQEATLSLRNESILFTVFLANLDIIEMLPPQRRVELAEGRESLWTKMQDGDYLLLGAYSCQDSHILLSTTLRPFNAAASLHHEINHLYEDKRGFAHLSTWNANKDIRVFTYLDEFMSSFQGAFFQRRLNLLNRGQYSQEATDFNLYRPDGVLPAMMDNIPIQAPFATDRMFNLHYGFTTDVSRVSSPLCELQQMILGGYFLNSGGPCNQSLLFPERDGSPESQFEMYLLFELANYRIDPNLFTQLMGEFEKFDNSFKAFSAVCEATNKAYSNGELGDYVGKSLKTRPGNIGIRPCLKVKY